jgi:release factor glutamine methyltransferase
MHTVASAFYDLKGKLQNLYDDREAAAIAHEVLEYITGLGKTDRLIHKERNLTAEERDKYENATASLLQGIPLQYVTRTAWFMGAAYRVDNNVLIPRPETEELVQWIVDDNRPLQKTLTILDIGTGSGCIPISLKHFLPDANVSSCDISLGALSVARKNAEALSVLVDLVSLDFLDAGARSQLGHFDIIVSNPPYIPISEKASLHINVAANEPGLALFVPDEDALVFYRAIADFGKQHLIEGGLIYCELDAAHAVETKLLFENEGYQNVSLRKDMHGNERMLRVGGF